MSHLCVNTLPASWQSVDLLDLYINKSNNFPIKGNGVNLLHTFPILKLVYLMCMYFQLPLICSVNMPAVRKCSLLNSSDTSTCGVPKFVILNWS